jgi:hypothetical protein
MSDYLTVYDRRGRRRLLDRENADYWPHPLTMLEMSYHALPGEGLYRLRATSRWLRVWTYHDDYRLRFVRLTKYGAASWLLDMGYSLPDHLAETGERLLRRRLLEPPPAHEDHGPLAPPARREEKLVAMLRRVLEEKGFTEASPSNRPDPASWEDESQSPPLPCRCSVELRGANKGPLVYGSEMPIVSPAAYAALQALAAAFDTGIASGLDAKALDADASRIASRSYTDVRTALRDLRKEHEAWCRAILPASGTRGRTRGTSLGWRLAAWPHD